MRSQAGRTGRRPVASAHLERKDQSLALLIDPVRRLPRLAGRALVHVYRVTLSPLIGFECRHLPTCSAYADEALDRFGLWAGLWMMCARLCRCHPFGTSGLDFVPDALPPRARWYLPWRYGRWRGRNDAAPRTPTMP